MFKIKSLFKDPSLIVTIDNLKQAVDQSQIGVLIDLRTQEEFASGHIKNSINIASNEIELKIASLVPLKTTRIFCIDTSGEKSYEIAKKLREMGYQLAFGVDSGMNIWKQKGFEVVSQ